MKWSSHYRLLILPILGLFLVLLALVTLPALAKGGTFGQLPIDIRARSEADYSGGRAAMQRPPLELAVIGDVLIDLEPGSTDIEARLTAVSDQLDTPVPTPPPRQVPSTTAASGLASSTPGASVTEATEMGSFTPPGTVTGTLTEVTSPASGTPATTETSAAASATASSTLAPGISPTPSSTSTTASGATSTQTPLSSATIQATVTSSPTSTPTLLPPSSTPTADACSSINLSGFNRAGQQIKIDLSNGSDDSVTITAIFLSWPAGNDEMVKVELNGDTIYDQADASPPTNITGGWKSGVSRNIGAGESKELLFQFGEPAANHGYYLKVTLNNGCTPDYSN